MTSLPARIAGLGLLGLALASCGSVRASATPTLTPFPFVTASPPPASTVVPATVTLPPAPTATSPPPAPTLRGSPVVPTIGPADAGTPLPTATISGVAGDCPVLPSGGFGTIFESDPGLRPAIGCPTSPTEDELPQAWTVESIWQPFERGMMVRTTAFGWDLDNPVVYAIYDEDGTYQRFDDAPIFGLPTPESVLTPPAGLLEPIGSLGRVWRDEPGVSSRLGWATGAEIIEFTHMQRFANGEMLFVIPVRQTYVFKQGSPNTWLTYDIGY